MTELGYNPDGYLSSAYCEECKETRSVSCSKTEAKKGGLVRVAATPCGHVWTLTSQQSNKLREEIAFAA